MDTIKLIAIGDIQVGIILFFISMPLVYRQVPMNKAYGIRIRAAFESEQRWYDINAYGGRQLAIWSWLLIVAGVTGFFVSPAHFDAYAYGSLGAAMLVVTMPLVLILRWSRRLAPLNKSDWLPALLSSAYGVVGTGDFNGDGKPDIVTTNATGPTIRFMNGTNKISDVSLTNNPPTLEAQVVGVGQFTGGEQADILWRDYTTGSNFVWVMQGTNVLGTTNLAKQGDVNWQVQGVGDFNGDGIADILWRHAVTGSNEIWLTSNPLSTSYANVVLPQITNLSWAIAGPK